MVLEHHQENRNEVVYPDEVAVLVISHFPPGVVVDRDLFGQEDGLGEVYEPDVGVRVVVDEQQGTSDNLGNTKKLYLQKKQYYDGAEGP